VCVTDWPAAAGFLAGGFSALASSSLACSAWLARTAFSALRACADIQASERGSLAGLSGAVAAVRWSEAAGGSAAAVPRAFLPLAAAGFLVLDAATFFFLAAGFREAGFLAVAGWLLSCPVAGGSAVASGASSVAVVLINCLWKSSGSRVYCCIIPKTGHSFNRPEAAGVPACRRLCGHKRCTSLNHIRVPAGLAGRDLPRTAKCSGKPADELAIMNDREHKRHRTCPG
jgi:hypothetical protein